MWISVVSNKREEVGVEPLYSRHELIYRRLLGMTIFAQVKRLGNMRQEITLSVPEARRLASAIHELIEEDKGNGTNR